MIIIAEWEGCLAGVDEDVAKTSCFCRIQGGAGRSALLCEGYLAEVEREGVATWWSGI